MKDQAQRLRELINNSRDTKAIVDKLNRTSQKHDARVIAISSGKGGVGKTNITVNLGLALCRLGKKVVIIDADLGLANIDVILGLVPKYNLMHLIKQEKSLEDIIIHGPNGLRIISGGSGIMDLVNLSESEILHLVDMLEALNSSADYILIDTGAGINKSVLSFIDASTEVVMIVTPDPTSITDAYAVIKNIVHTDKKICVIINKAESHKEGHDVFHKVNAATKRFLNLELESLGIILDDVHVKKAVRQQKPFFLSAPNAIASKSIELIAYNLENNSRYIQDTKPFNVFIKRLFSSI